MLTAKRFSTLAIGLIAALITSSSTFTLVYAQHTQNPINPHVFGNGHTDHTDAFSFSQTDTVNGGLSPALTEHIHIDIPGLLVAHP